MHALVFRPRRPPRIADAVLRRTITVQRATPGELAAQRQAAKSRTRASKPDDVALPQPPRNAAGVQLLSPSLRAQLFPPDSPAFPPPPAHAVKRSLQHLAAHGLDTSAASTLPALDIALPKLMGRTLDEHFHRLGRHTAEPSLSLARAFAAASLPPIPDSWALQSGWTKYSPDGSYEHIACLPADERALVFDIENMPHYSSYAIMACAASESAWYCWLSPWILGETEDDRQLIPFGPAAADAGAEGSSSSGGGGTRVVVGHNVSYDRARVKDEYSLTGTKNCWVDTMSLHVATHGISSHQRPAWNKYKSARKAARTRATESLDCLRGMITEYDRELEALEEGDARREELEERRRDVVAGLEKLLVEREDGEGIFDEEADEEAEDVDGGAGAGGAKRWEKMTSGNSLVDVARLHCGITVEKDRRDDLLVLSRAEIRADIDAYIAYCASDVATTHAVFRVVLPSFLATCPSPVTWAGIMTMGSAFLPVDQEWERYIARAEGKYAELSGGVKTNLEALAEQARAAGWDGAKDDVWLTQLDWSEKKPRRARGGGGGAQLREGEGEGVPAWYWEFTEKPPLHESNVKRFLPLLLRLGVAGEPLVHSDKLGWLAQQPFTDPPLAVPDQPFFKLGKATVHKVLAKRFQALETPYPELWERLVQGERGEEVERELIGIAESMRARGAGAAGDGWEGQLDWTQVTPRPPATTAEGETWPKWYWDLTVPKPGELPRLDITARSRVAPILLRLRWQGFPLFHSREHGWTYRVTLAEAGTHKSRQKRLAFGMEEDTTLAADVERGHVFYKLPHKAGEEQNVGSPLAKSFVKFASDGVLSADTGQSEEAKNCAAQALDMNAQCSYWISARDRVMKQLVVWQHTKDGLDLGFEPESAPDAKRGIILPQVVTMGTVTRRAIEKTWLTASNAKKNRVGSELKAMVRAPAGYSIVGADVDSEELWISSVMGDAQFGMHGATAIGWMTLEGTKAHGTDLHSKTASILGISRDQAKVFNYSRIYGAGLKHAMLLMLQSNPSLMVEDAQKLVQQLYASTKGSSTRTDRYFDRKFWYGGTESFLFNKLEEIALSDKPLTPALGCGVTRALTKEYLGLSDYLPSRINWVVQSSGVDYLHLLIVGMQYLMDKYNISARYLISVHDELRYLVTDEDRYRAAMALQIANLWTRSLFAFKLGIDDLPQGVAFFSAVDVDKYLRKETDMTCVTPSQIEPLPPGESLDIEKLLKVTNGGTLRADGEPMAVDEDEMVGDMEGYVEPDCMIHRSSSPAWLRAQATNELSEIRMLWKAEQEQAGIRTPRSDAPPAPKAKTGKGADPKSETKFQKMKRQYNKKEPTQSRAVPVLTHAVASTPVTFELWAEQQANILGKM